MRQDKVSVLAGTWFSHCIHATCRQSTLDSRSGSSRRVEGRTSSRKHSLLILHFLTLHALSTLTNNVLGVLRDNRGDDESLADLKTLSLVVSSRSPRSGAPTPNAANPTLPRALHDTSSFASTMEATGTPEPELMEHTMQLSPEPQNAAKPTT